MGAKDGKSIINIEKETDERNSKGIKYRVNYQKNIDFLVFKGMTINQYFILEIEGYLNYSQKSKNYTFDPFYFSDYNSQDYYDKNWEEIEQEIINYFYSLKENVNENIIIKFKNFKKINKDE